MALPLDLLEESLNKDLELVLKDGRVILGRLVGYDQYMNVVLEDSTERTQERDKKIGTIVLRGNNLITIAQPRMAQVRST